MSEWREIALGEVLDITHGYPFKGEFFSDAGDHVLLTPRNFRAQGGLDVSPARCKYYTGPIDQKYVLAPGDVVVAMTDLKNDAPILGSAGVIPSAGHYLHNQRIGKVNVDRPDQLSDAFVPWLLNSPGVRSQVKSSATGATVRHSAPERFGKIVVRIPAPECQRRIAAVLSAFDELIEINERRIEVLEDLARSLYREWFVRFRFPGHRRADFAESDLGPIPDDWEVCSLGDIAEVQRRTVTPVREDGIEFEHFSIPAFDSSGLPRFEVGAAIKSHKQVVDRECVLLSKINPRIERVWFAEPSTNRAVASTEFLAFTGSHVSNAWLWATFTSEAFQGWLRGVAGGTSTSHQRVKPGDVTAHVVPLANRELVDLFDGLVAPALRGATALRQSSRALAATRDLLLPRLVTGRVDISDVDLGELLPPEPA